jgi:hypothetical protein
LDIEQPRDGKRLWRFGYDEGNCGTALGVSLNLTPFFLENFL